MENGEEYRRIEYNKVEWREMAPPALLKGEP